MMRMRSEFENKLNENKVQFARIREKNISSFYVNFKIETQNIKTLFL